MQEKRVSEQKEFQRQQRLDFDKQVDTFKDERGRLTAMIQEKDARIESLEAQVILIFLLIFGLVDLHFRSKSLTRGWWRLIRRLQNKYWNSRGLPWSKELKISQR